jgi:RNA polymerase sigma-70 factor (ECF subfamily)
MGKSGCNTLACSETNGGVNADDTSAEARFSELVRSNRTRLWGIARAYGRAEADDLLQEILLQVWRALPRFRGESRVDTWCYRVALNTALDWRRKSERRRASGTTGCGTDAAECARRLDGETDEALLARFLDTLSDTDRACLLMYLEDLDHAGIAEVLGVSEGAARTRLSRIKSKLAEWEPLDP